jgi:hypothetical protein
LIWGVNLDLPDLWRGESLLDWAEAKKAPGHVVREFSSGTGIEVPSLTLASNGGSYEDQNLPSITSSWIELRRICLRKNLFFYLSCNDKEVKVPLVGIGQGERRECCRWSCHVDPFTR